MVSKFLPRPHIQAIGNETVKSIAKTIPEIILTAIISLYIDSCIESYQMRKHKAPEHVQKQAEKFFDAMHKNDNFYKRILAWCKKKLGYITVYQGGKDKTIKKRNCGAFYQRGIFFPSGSFSEEKTPPSLNAALCHEVAHAWQDSPCSLWTFWPSDKNRYKIEYEAEKMKMKKLYELNMKEEIEEALLDRIERKIKMEIGELDLKKQHPYVYGTIDGFFEFWVDKEKDLLNLFGIVFEIEKEDLFELLNTWAEKTYGDNPKLMSEAKKSILKSSTEIKNWRAISWQERYKSYRLALDNQKKQLVTSPQQIFQPS